MKPEAENKTREPAEEITGFPGLPTWREVYVFVMACFVAMVFLLYALPWIFS